MTEKDVEEGEIIDLSPDKDRDTTHDAKVKDQVSLHQILDKTKTGSSNNLPN